jgi:hypothetical protein
MARVPLHHRIQRGDHRSIALHHRTRGPVVRRPRESYDPAGTLHR